MKGWITATLLVTFFSGASTGFLVGRKSAPEPVVLTKIDRYVEHCRTTKGVTDQADLDEIRAIYEAYEEEILAWKNQIDRIFLQQLERIDKEFEAKIQTILDKYGEKE